MATAAEEEARAEARWPRLLCWEQYAPCVYARRAPELPFLRGENLGYAESVALDVGTVLLCLTLTCALMVIGATTAYSDRGVDSIGTLVAVCAVGGMSAAAVVGLAAVRTVLSMRTVGPPESGHGVPPLPEARLLLPAVLRVSVPAAPQFMSAALHGVINPLCSPPAPKSAPPTTGLRSAGKQRAMTSPAQMQLAAAAAAAPSTWYFLDGLVDATHARQRGPYPLASIAAWSAQGVLVACEATLVRQEREGGLITLSVALAAAAAPRVERGGNANAKPSSRRAGKRAMTSPAQMQLAAARMQILSGEGGVMSSSIAAAAAAGSIPAMSPAPRAWWTDVHVRVGTSVMHPKRGNGTVEALSPGGDGRVHVRFKADDSVHRYAEKSWLKFFSMHDLFTEALGADDMGVQSADARRTSQRAFLRCSREFSRAAIDAALAAGQPPASGDIMHLPSEEEEEEGLEEA